MDSKYTYSLALLKLSLFPFRRLIIDTDAGVDDAIALVMALTMTLNATTTAPPANLSNSSSQGNRHLDPPSPLQIEAITTVTGNAPANKVAVNVWRVLRAVGMEKVGITAMQVKTGPIEESIVHIFFFQF